ncbi:hypothetical protein L873DRAFT_1885182 [Choiromyces venosus 120613-1]|uniref:Signal recognition particle subunit SRP72 n=1 Tax=Choiromyces venosus 120613-1 TaxID=1336337 RepID=A0A3N4IY38_9PEZI|nr:hypothetical protein L873DRAFT_1885182 [Choiromyces venosus 120613-1]
MSQYTPATLESLLSTLSIAGGGEADHASILKHANNVLKSEKSHKRALHTKAVALINLDRYEDALAVLSQAELAGQAILERAYCLYKLGRLEDALATAAGGRGGRDERGLKHVEAQAAYRLEKFGQAAGIYADLSRGGYQAENEDYDMSVNVGATNAQLVWANGSAAAGIGGGDKVDRGALDAFETAFNAACGAVARGAFGQALVLLKRAKELGMLLEDLSEEERRVEIAPVLAQEVYVLAKMGRWEEALERLKDLDVPRFAKKKFYTEIDTWAWGANLSASITDTSLKVIATNNEIAITSRLPDYNPHLSLITSAQSSTITTTISSKAFLFQSKILNRNRAIQELEAGKTQAAKKQAQAHLQTHPYDSEASVILAAARAHGDSSSNSNSTSKVEKLVEKNPGDVGLSLTLAQLRMRSGNITGAITAVENVMSAAVDEQKYLPGVVGLLVGLYSHQGRRQHVKEVLARASGYWMTCATPNHPLLRASAKSHLDTPTPSPTDLSTANSIFTLLLSQTPQDPFSSAGLLASSSPSTTTTTPPQNLTPLQTLLSKTDAAALEAAGVAQPPPRKRALEEDAGAKGSAGKAVVRKKKKKTHKFDTNKTPDPERWLPVRDRSGYKPKGKKARARAAGATQGGGGGGGGGGEESMELAGGGRVDVLKVHGNVNANKGKKKKKGGRW